MPETTIQLREKNAGVEVSLHVQPRARRNEICGFHDGAIKLKISAPPVDDAANRAVVDFFSDLLGIPKARIRIIAGDKSRRKTLRIEGIRRREFLNACGIAGEDITFPD